MDPRTPVWERLLLYREELVRLCERVALELAENRRRREAWLAWSEGWKRHRLARSNAATPGDSGPTGG